MNNSSFKIYCLYKRIAFIFWEENYDMFPRLLEPVQKGMFESTPKYIKDQCYRIFNEIENAYYTFDDLVGFLMYRSLWDKKVKLDEVNGKSVRAFKERMTLKQLKRDKEVLGEINEQAKLGHISEYFLIRENGESLIYRLCMKEIVSIYFFAYFVNTPLTGFIGNITLKHSSREYQKFHKTTQLIVQYLNLPTKEVQDAGDQA